MEIDLIPILTTLLLAISLYEIQSETNKQLFVYKFDKFDALVYTSLLISVCFLLIIIPLLNAGWAWYISIFVFFLVIFAIIPYVVIISQDYIAKKKALISYMDELFQRGEENQLVSLLNRTSEQLLDEISKQDNKSTYNRMFQRYFAKWSRSESFMKEFVSKNRSLVPTYLEGDIKPHLKKRILKYSIFDMLENSEPSLKTFLNDEPSEDELIYWLSTNNQFDLFDHLFKYVKKQLRTYHAMKEKDLEISLSANQEPESLNSYLAIDFYQKLISVHFNNIISNQITNQQTEMDKVFKIITLSTEFAKKNKLRHNRYYEKIIEKCLKIFKDLILRPKNHPLEKFLSEKQIVDRGAFVDSAVKYFGESVKHLSVESIRDNYYDEEGRSLSNRIFHDAAKTYLKMYIKVLSSEQKTYESAKKIFQKEIKDWFRYMRTINIDEEKKNDRCNLIEHILKELKSNVDPENEKYLDDALELLEEKF